MKRVGQFAFTLTKPQQESLWRLFLRVNPSATMPAWSRAYRRFRRTVHYGDHCAMVPLWNMWLGIETDGYTHS